MAMPDVLIVGAGPVGLTMAAALVTQGIRCRIIDQAPLPSDKSKALVIWSRSLELLDKLGLSATFINTGMKLRGASIHGDGRRLVHVQTAGVESPFGFPLMIPQNETERLLTEFLAQHQILIERQVELVTFDEQLDEVPCQLRHADGRTETLAVRWLIGCDGAHSTVRHTLGMPFSGSAEPNDWLLADIHIEGALPLDEVSVFWHQTGALVIFPITPGRFRVVADLGMAATAERRADPTLNEVQAIVDQRGPGGLKLSDPVWLAAFRINERKVSDYRRGRVMLAGDAAHIHSPAGGQGMNTGMQDAFNLAWKLALIVQGQANTEVLLDSYSTERSAVGDQVLHGAEIITRVATLRNPVAQYVRNHVASLVSSFGFVQDKIKNALCELSINYRHSPLSTDAWQGSAGELMAGDRLPDAALESAANARATTLFGELRSLAHGLLLFCPVREGAAELVAIAEQVERAFGGLVHSHVIFPAGASSVDLAALAAAPCEFWIDRGKLFDKFGVTAPALVLVRPDGYLGYRCQPASGDALVRYLKRYLVRGA